MFNENEQGEKSLVDIGSRIFSKAVEEKVPTPKNVKRRDMRLGRRVLQRRARRKQRMISYLVSLQLLPTELKTTTYLYYPLKMITWRFSIKNSAASYRVLKQSQYILVFFTIKLY